MLHRAPKTARGLTLATALLGSLLAPGWAQAEDYVIDTKGAHAFVQFRIQHLGFLDRPPSAQMSQILQGSSFA